MLEELSASWSLQKWFSPAKVGCARWVSWRRFCRRFPTSLLLSASSMNPFLQIAIYCHSFHPKKAVKKSPAKITIATKRWTTRLPMGTKDKNLIHQVTQPFHTWTSHLQFHLADVGWPKNWRFPSKNWMSTDTPYKAQHAGGMSPPKWYWHCSSSMIHPNLVLCRQVLFSLIAEHKIETRSLVTPRAPVEQLWHVVTLGPTCAEVDVTWAAWITSFRGIQVALQNIWWCPSTTMPAIPKTLDAK